MKDAYNGTGYFDKEYKGYSAIAGLYTEAIQVAVLKDSDINSISDLYGKSVSLGEKNRVYYKIQNKYYRHTV